MAVDLSTVDWESWEGLPKPGTRVRIPWGGSQTIEGVVTHALSPMRDGPQVRVGFWLGGIPGNPDCPDSYIEIPVARERMEIISEE